jgi:membrane-associated phospholipid phosphatase
LTLARIILQAISDCGDLALLLPLALVLAVLLWLRQSRRAALLLIACLCLCLGAILLLKLLFLSCGRLWWPAMRSPSGHAGASAFVYGAWLTVHRVRVHGAATRLWGGVLLALIFTIATSRILLGYHTLPEVLLGSGVGLLGWAGFAHAWRRLPSPPIIDTRWLALWLSFALVTFHAQRLPAEHWIGRAASAMSCGM